MLGHVEMEARACLMFRLALQAQHSISSRGEAAKEMVHMADRGQDMLASFNRWFNENRVRLDDWSAIQATLKLPEYTGLGGAQNTGVCLLGEILGVAEPAHPANKALEAVAEAHFVRHQRQVAQLFRERRCVLRDHVKSPGASELERASFDRLVRASVLWRASHRARVLKYVGAAQGGHAYRTSTGQLADMRKLAAQFDSRIEEYETLRTASRL